MENVENPGSPRPPLSAGSQLREAREAAGLSRTDIASRTKVAERHLLAIEEDRFGDLAARTYAVGFARAYARALGIDEKDIAEKVRRQLDSEGTDRPVVMPSFEPGDPARVPPLRLAWIAAGGALVVIIALLVFWSSFFSPEGKLPDLIADKPAAAPTPAAPPRPVQGAPAAGPVVLTATGDNVWIKVTDAIDAQLVQKELAKGETWTVPQGANAPRLRIGRPDALQISVGGKVLPALSDKPQTMSGVSLVAADLLARGNPAAAPAVPQAAAPTGVTGAPAAPRPQRTPARLVASPTPAPTPAPTTEPAAAPAPAGPAPLSTTSQ